MISFTKRAALQAAFLISINACTFPLAFAQQTGNAAQTIEKNPIDQTVKSIRFKPGSSLTPDQAQEVFRQYLGLDGTDNLMMSKHNTTTKTGLTTMRYSQYYKGIPVRLGGATLLVKNNNIELLTANYYPFGDNPSTVPVLTERAAFEKAKAFVGADLYKWQIAAEEAFIKKQYNNPDTSFMPTGRLVWMEDMMTDKPDRQMRLAYSFDIYAEKPLSRQEVFVDAATGAVLFSNAMIKHTAASGATRYSGTLSFVTAKPASTYILFDSSRGGGVYTLNLNNGTSYGSATNFASTTNTWPTGPTHNIALDAHWGTEMVYDYWLNEHGRHSWDDLDGVLQSYVHYATNYNNAFWNGAYMTYGDGSGSGSGGFDPLTSLDVTAHEIGHGVCEATAGLVYTKESGAMNEGFSDCWGAVIEHYADPKETDAQPKRVWYIGEEIRNGNPLRRMDFPKLKNNPDTYGGTYWTTITGCTPTSSNDYCGVHNNSGVLNKFFFLLTDGGSGTNDLGNTYSVTGVGWTKSPEILYQTELVLSSTATYADCRAASINVALTLYGPCSPEVKSVTDAWYAVGVGAAFVPCVATIGFDAATMDISEQSTSTFCPAATVYKIGVKPMGDPFIGGSPVVNVTAVGGTADPGRDYLLGSTTLTFPLGSTATQYANLTVYDNGVVKDNRTVVLAFTLSAMGSTALINTTYDTLTISLKNNDSIPDVLTPVETALGSICSLDIRKSEEVYFYTPVSQKLIAGVQKASSALNCTEARIAQAGVGMMPTSFSSGKRTVKEIKITPAATSPTLSYDLSIYYTNAELAGADPASLRLLKTDAPTDATITASNTVIITPVVSSGTDYKGFKASLTGIGAATRFYLVDDNASLSAASWKTERAGLTLVPNPNNGVFTVKGKLDHSTVKEAYVVISNMLGQKLYDATVPVNNGVIDAEVSVAGKLPQAVYLVKVIAEKEEQVFRLLIQ